MKIDSAYYTKDQDVIIVQMPFDMYDIEETQGIVDTFKWAFPNNKIIFIPSDLSISILREENPFL